MMPFLHILRNGKFLPFTPNFANSWFESKTVRLDENFLLSSTYQRADSVLLLSELEWTGRLGSSSPRIGVDGQTRYFFSSNWSGRADSIVLLFELECTGRLGSSSLQLGVDGQTRFFFSPNWSARADSVLLLFELE